MKYALCCLLACLLTSGCRSHNRGEVHTDIVQRDGQSDIQVLVGTVSIRDAVDGTREIVLEARNRTDQVLWVPSTDGSRGIIGCEAVNISELADSLRGVHYDHAICHFPDQYMVLMPGGTCRYVYEMPDSLSEQISISVWAPWRDSSGELVSQVVKRDAVPEHSILIEEVKGSTEDNEAPTR